MGDTISFTRDNTTEVNTNKNGYTEAQQREYMVRTASDLVKENRKVQEEELYTDSNFIDSMRILYNKEQGMDAETPEDKELVKWGLGYLADVNYNLVDLGEAAYDFSEATDLEKMAMAYGLDTYDSKDVTMDGVQRFAEAFATDPTNLIGFGTLGAGFAAKFTGKTLAKQAFKKMLMNPANIAAIEGAAFLGAEDTMRQNLDVEIGAQEEYSATQGLTSVAVGAAGGKVLGEVASWAGKKLSKVPKEAIDEVHTIQNELNSPQIKSDFGPELLVGGVAGIEEDEQGNISFDPIKFMEGFLAGHVAKRIMANKKLTEPMKKEAMAYAQRTFDKLEANPKFDYLTGTMRVVETGNVPKKSIKEVETKKDSRIPKRGKIKLYHGTNAEFDEFGKVGDKITSLGYGYYFTPDMDIAKQYGKNIKVIEIDSKDILDLDNLSDMQRKDIINELDKVVPDDIKAGYGEIKKIDITDMEDDKALKLWKQKKEETKDLYHDRAKASIEEDGDKVYIQWMDPGLDNATDANLKNLIQEYNQDIPKSLGYKATHNSGEVAIYDKALVNKSIIKNGQK
jgi:hypothetical protein